MESLADTKVCQDVSVGMRATGRFGNENVVAVDVTVDDTCSMDVFQDKNL